jgi:hypothetical protein
LNGGASIEGTAHIHFIADSGTANRNRLNAVGARSELGNGESWVPELGNGKGQLSASSKAKFDGAPSLIEKPDI